MQKRPAVSGKKGFFSLEPEQKELRNKERFKKRLNKKLKRIEKLESVIKEEKSLFLNLEKHQGDKDRINKKELMLIEEEDAKSATSNENKSQKPSDNAK